MTTATKKATIYYSIDGGEYQKYISMISHNDACTISTYCTADGLLASPVMSYSFDMFISKTAWKLVSVDSQHGENEARFAFDGKNDTFWHTEWGASEPPCPHTLIIDMVKIYKVTAITYLSRQDGNENGMVKAYEIYLSNDGKTWGTAVATGEFQKTTSLQQAKLKTATAGRYLKFVAKSEINGRAWTSCAEIGIAAEADVTGMNDILLNNKNYTMNNEVYDLQGRRLSTPKAGIYVSNGRKILR